MSVQLKAHVDNNLTVMDPSAVSHPRRPALIQLTEVVHAGGFLDDEVHLCGSKTWEGRGGEGRGGEGEGSGGRGEGEGRGGEGRERGGEWRGKCL